MKSILKNERAHYNDMKKLFNSKEMEIRRLKRENHNIKTEIQTCSSLLRRGQQIELQTLNNQVGFLHNENRKLSKELTEMEKKLKDLASDQNLEWIQSLMTSATFETRDLKDKLMREMMEKTSLSDNFARAQRELAKARLDCVKLKILLGRIVDANGIKIDENDFDDIDIEQEVLENLKIEEFESLDGSMTLETMDDGTELNESTITLIGGRERLGNFIPPKEEKIELDSKENLKVSSSPKPSISPRIEPLKPIPIPKHSSNKEESKVVNFSSTVETKVIETTRAQFEESNQARKRNPIVVKRIVISSRATKKIE